MDQGNHGGCALRKRKGGYMTDEPRDHRRRSLRLLGYEYSQAGAYFVTICTQDHRCLFGEIEDGNMRLNDAGTMIHTVWDQIPSHYPGVDIDEFVIMPNHIHGVVIIVGAGPRACPDSVQPQGVVQDDGSGQPRGRCPYGGDVITGCCSSVQNHDHETVH